MDITKDVEQETKETGCQGQGAGLGKVSFSMTCLPLHSWDGRRNPGGGSFQPGPVHEDQQAPVEVTCSDDDPGPVPGFCWTLAELRL